MFSILFITVSTFSTIYLGMHIQAAFLPAFGHRFLLWLGVILITQINTIARYGSRTLHIRLPEYANFIVYSVFAFVTLAVILCFVFDIIYLFTKYVKPLNFIYNFIEAKPATVGFICLALVLLQFCIGIYNTNSINIVNYTVKSAKLNSNERVRIALIADIHVNSMTSEKKLEQAVSMINEEAPDLLLIAGDFVDSGVRQYQDKNINAIFSKVKSKHGVYAVFGNHEHYNGGLNPLADAMADGGIRLLKDEAVYIDSINTILVGRNDIHALRNTMSKNLAQISEDPQNNLTIVVDHQPAKDSIEEARQSGADIMLSGHTHNGQIFPFNLLVKKRFKHIYGLYHEGDLNVIVTSGLGTWGPPIRTTGHAEIVIIDVVGE